jgi:hypothetical protein
VKGGVLPGGSTEVQLLCCDFDVDTGRCILRTLEYNTAFTLGTEKTTENNI